MPERVALVVPCFNEADRFLDTDFSLALEENSRLFLLFVNDGSRDSTAEILKAFVDRYPLRAEVLNLPENQGKAEAVRAGVRYLTREGKPDVSYFGYWDADLATPFREVKRFIDVFSTRPRLILVMGARVNLLGRKVRRKAIRHYLGRVFATAASLVLNLPVYDTQCGAKIFRYNTEVLALFEKPFVSGWIFDVELLARLVASLRAQSAEDSVYELPLLEWEDVAGSKIKGRDFFKAMVSLFRIAKLYPRVSSHN